MKFSELKAKKIVLTLGCIASCAYGSQTLTLRPASLS
jgi:hypothetical protein